MDSVFLIRLQTWEIILTVTETKEILKFHILLSPEFFVTFRVIDCQGNIINEICHGNKLSEAGAQSKTYLMLCTHQEIQLDNEENWPQSIGWALGIWMKCYKHAQVKVMEQRFRMTVSTVSTILYKSSDSSFSF